jgi:hypothetical protein
MANLGSKKPFLFKKVFIYKNGKFIKEIESVKGAAKWLKIPCGKIAIAGSGQLYMIVFVTFSTATVNNTGGAYYFIPVATS